MPPAGRTFLIAFALAAIAHAQSALPEAPAKKIVEKVCSACHDTGTATGERHTKAGWNAVIDAMANRGARATDQEFDAIAEYLTKYFGPVNVNQATAEEIAKALNIDPKQADAIVKYRTENGEFKDLDALKDALKKVPGIDASVIEDRKDRIVFK
jgi:competence ComEA-like helix-hairpin-helix protein